VVVAQQDLERLAQEEVQPVIRVPLAPPAYQGRKVAQAEQIQVAVEAQEIPTTQAQLVMEALAS
jgi:hypothetical protein